MKPMHENVREAPNEYRLQRRNLGATHSRGPIDVNKAVDRAASKIIRAMKKARENKD